MLIVISSLVIFKLSTKAVKLSSLSLGGVFGLLFGVVGFGVVPGVWLIYLLTYSDISGRNITANINIPKIKTVPIELFLLLSNIPIAVGVNSFCSNLIFLYLYLILHVI